jgi:hypothetical protein
MGRLTLILAAWATLCGLAEARPLRAAGLDRLWTVSAGAVPSAFAPEYLPAAPVLIAPPKVTRGPVRLQCAIYARARSGVSLNGAAASWWTKAHKLYERSKAPAEGAVIVLGGTRSGHVAVVSRVVSATQILVDHANWGNRGEVIIGALMVDVSANNDWSRVRVWHPPTNGLGLRRYPVFGFILPVRANAQIAAG